MRTKAASYLAALLAAACGGDDASQAPPPAPQTLAVERVFPLLSFTAPVAMLQAPGDGTRWFVVELGGRVLVFDNSPQAASSSVFADISDRVLLSGEMGLLGMAFHPDFPANARVYLSYSNGTSGLINRVSEFMLSAGGNLDPASERVLLSVAQVHTSHNGGHLAFGPDGYLYVSRGDGVDFNNSQLTSTLLGKMLRIDVSPASGYGIPPGNPFAGNAQCGAGGSGALPCPEIYASGFRNPWRWSFDRATGALWLGDVGASTLEEIDRVVLGANYGWPCFEGTLPLIAVCGTTQFPPPVAEYGRQEGAAVTGGYVYRGSAIAGLAGRYVLGDFISGRLWEIPGDTQPTATITGGVQTGLNIVSFGEDVDGELYIVHYGGQLFRLVSR